MPYHHRYRKDEPRGHGDLITVRKAEDRIKIRSASPYMTRGPLMQRSLINCTYEIEVD